MENNLDRILEAYPEEEFLLMEGRDSAIIGVDPGSMRLIYSVTKLIANLMSEGMTEEDAFEFYAFNIACAYVGEKTPILCDDTTL